MFNLNLWQYYMEILKYFGFLWMCNPFFSKCFTVAPMSPVAQSHGHSCRVFFCLAGMGFPNGWQKRNNVSNHKKQLSWLDTMRKATINKTVGSACLCAAAWMGLGLRGNHGPWHHNCSSSCSFPLEEIVTSFQAVKLRIGFWMSQLIK